MGYLRWNNGSGVSLSSTGPAGQDNPNLILNDGLNNPRFGIGTSTPWAIFSIGTSTPSGTNPMPLFVVATSTGSATTTIFVVNGKGFTGIGTTSPATALEVGGDITDDNIKNCANSTSALGTDSNGKVVCNSTISDQRLKTNVISLDGTNVLSEIDQLNPVSFYWVDPTMPGAQSTAQQFGFIAQQVQNVLPNLVSSTSPTALTPGYTYTLNYQGFIPLAVKAIQELNLQIQNLEASSTTQNSATITNTVTNWFSSLGVAIENSVFHFTNLIVDTLTTTTEYVNTINAKNLNAEVASVGMLSVGSTSTPQDSGITIIDRATGKPYCIFVNNGIMQSTLGACGTFTTPPVNQNNNQNPPPINTSTTTPPVSDTTTSTSTDAVATSTPPVDTGIVATTTDTTATDTSTSTTP